VKALDNSTDSPTSNGKVDWFAFLSFINGCLRIHSGSPLGIGPDSELCFSIEDAVHAVTFSCEGSQLFVSPEKGEASMNGELILNRVAVEPNTTLYLGRLPLFIATSPILDTTPPFLLQDRVEPKEDVVAANVVQLPGQVSKGGQAKAKATDDSGIGEILVPANIPPQRRWSDQDVGKKSKPAPTLWIWRLALLLCLAAGAIFPWFKYFMPADSSVDDTSVPLEASPSKQTPSELVLPGIDQADTKVTPLDASAEPSADASSAAPATARSGIRILASEAESQAPKLARTDNSERAAERARAAQRTRAAERAVAVEAQVDAVEVKNDQPPVTIPKVEKSAKPVAKPEVAAVAEVPIQTVSVPTPALNPEPEQTLESAPLTGEGGATPDSAYSAIEQVDTEHLLVAAQWAMRNGDAPGALILLEAITTKFPDHAQAVVLRDQLRRIMAEVEIE